MPPMPPLQRRAGLLFILFIVVFYNAPLHAQGQDRAQRDKPDEGISDRHRIESVTSLEILDATPGKKSNDVLYLLYRARLPTEPTKGVHGLDDMDQNGFSGDYGFSGIFLVRGPADVATTRNEAQRESHGGLLGLVYTAGGDLGFEFNPVVSGRVVWHPKRKNYYLVLSRSLSYHQTFAIVKVGSETETKAWPRKKKFPSFESTDGWPEPLPVVSQWETQRVKGLPCGIRDISVVPTDTGFLIAGHRIHARCPTLYFTFSFKTKQWTRQAKITAGQPVEKSHRENSE